MNMIDASRIGKSLVHMEISIQMGEIPILKTKTHDLLSTLLGVMEVSSTSTSIVTSTQICFLYYKVSSNYIKYDNYQFYLTYLLTSEIYPIL